MPSEKDTEAVNVEGILANFFLKKLEMEDSKSDSDSSGKRHKKHKKHKSKKSKNKCKKRSRSRSTERKSKDSLYSGDHSSSEEKDILRLQRLKKLDFKDNKLTSVDSLIASEASNSVSTALTTDPNSVKESDIPYGPSLETLLSGVSDNVHKEKAKIMDAIESTVSEAHINSTKDHSICDENKIGSNVLSSEVNSQNKVESTAQKVIINAQNVIKDDEGKNVKEEKQPEKQYSNAKSTADKKHKRKKRSYTKSRSRSPSNSRSRKKSRSRSRSRENRKGYKDHSARRRSRSASRRRSRSSSYDRNRNRSRYTRNRSRTPLRDKDRYAARDDFKYSRRRRSSSSDYEYRSRKSNRRSRSNSVDRERGSSKNLKIDQEKIRQLAQKNVLNMIEKGTLPEGLSLENFKKEQLVSLKAGGKSVQELTDFCAKLSKKENDPQRDEAETAGDSSAAEEGFIHHPFKIRETSSIKLNIKNAVQIPIKTHAEKVAETARLSSQFPVSSGNQHRQKELEWVPVVPTVKEGKVSKDAKALVPLSQSSTITELHKKKSSEEDQPTAQSDSVPSVTSIPVPNESTIPALLPPPLPPVLPELPPPPPPLPPNNLSTPDTYIQNTCVPACLPNDYASQSSFSYPVATMACNYFPQTETHSYMMQPQQTVYPVSTTTNYKSKKPIDVASVITQRFKALTKLQSNPNDSEALQNLEHAQASIQDWVQSQQVPGLFTGSTGAKPLSVEQLSGPRHWLYRAKKDIFIRAAPVTEGKGMSLLKKMGWNPGEGLGKNKEGSLEPLVLDIKTDKKGLVSEGEGSKKIVSSVLKDLEGKHPVSALMELCSKRKWKPPLYTLLKETGPPHKKLFLFKVEVNNVEYQSANPVNNKKVAKADAAVICLQALNVFSK